MRKTVLFAVVSLFAGELLFAQGVQPPQARPGSVSLSFLVGTALDFFGVTGTGPNGGLGVAYFLTSNMALRAGLQGHYGTRSIPTNLPTGGTDGSASLFTVAASLDYLFYPGSVGGVRPYLGGGVSFATSNTDTKPVDRLPFTETKGGDVTGLSAEGILGAEFYIQPGVSIAAEYQLGLVSYTTTSDLVTVTGTTTTTVKMGTSITYLGFGSVGLMLRLYF